MINEGIQQSTDGLAIKQDVEHAITKEVNRLLRWLMTAAITLGGAIVALLIALIVRGSQSLVSWPLQHHPRPPTLHD